MQTPAVGYVHAIIARTSNRRFQVNATQTAASGITEQTSRSKGGVQRPTRAKALTYQSSLGIDVECFGLVHSEHVYVVKLEHRVRIKLPGIAQVPLLRIRIPVIRFHYAARITTCELCCWRRNRWQWI